MNILKFTFILLITLKITPSSTNSNFLGAKYYFTLLKHYLESFVAKAGGDTECAEHLKLLLTDLINKKPWAWQMVDATAKVQPGLLTGNIMQIGNYDGCLSIFEENNGSVVQGQYCTVVLLPSANYSNEFSFLLNSKTLFGVTGGTTNFKVSDLMAMVKLTYGICIPLSCSIENLQKIWDYVEHTFQLSIHVIFYNLLCSHKEKLIEPYAIDYYVFAFFFVIMCIVLFSTYYDYCIYQRIGKRDKNIYQNYLVAFSLHTNIKNLIATPENNEKNDFITCANGIKVLSMLWILLGHRFLVNILTPNINGFYLFEWKRHAENTIIVGGSFAVDTFFVLSGMFISYIYLKKTITNNISFNLMEFYLSRILRLMPPLLAVILFYISVIKYLNDGPFWPLLISKISGSCLYTWWATLFFMTNFVDIKHQCIEQSWYLAVDAQLYFISPVILIGLNRHPQKTFLLVSAAGIASAIYAYIITVVNNYGAIYFEGDKNYHTYIYQSTFIRMPCWLIGVFFGYLIFQYRRVKLSKNVNVVLWCFALTTIVVILWSHVLFTRSEYNPVRSAIFNSIARPLWGLAISYIVFSCATGNGGIINNFLSLPFFSILSKVSYSFYLVHLGVIFYLFGSKRTVDYFNNLKAVHDFSGDLHFSLKATAFMYFMFEAPFINIKILLSQKLLSKKKQKSMGTNTNKDHNKFGKKNLLVCLYSYDEDLTIEKKQDVLPKESIKTD